jgi:hypothetical protein
VWKGEERDEGQIGVGMTGLGRILQSYLWIKSAAKVELLRNRMPMRTKLEIHRRMGLVEEGEGSCTIS